MIDRHEAECCLGRVLDSPAFKSSPRCQEFLRFVVAHTLDGAPDVLKERTIAEQVFRRGPDYDPSADSLVRVKASDVRRRLAQYYGAEGQTEAWRIELPVGSYVPRFVCSVQREPETVLEEASVEAALVQDGARPLFGRRRAFRFVAALAALPVAGFSVNWLRARQSVFQDFWAPVMKSPQSLLIFLPVPETYVKSRDREGEFQLHSDRVGMGAARGAMRFVELCVRSGKQYSVKAGADLSFADLRDHPTVLFGAFSSMWPREVNNDYRFQLVPGRPAGKIVDAQDASRSWVPIGATTDGWASVDYAVAARIFDARTGQPVILASGVTTFGTQAAAEFLTSADSIEQLARQSGRTLNRTSFQVILQTRIIGNTSGSPTVVATHFWS